MKAEKSGIYASLVRKQLS